MADASRYEPALLESHASLLHRRASSIQSAAIAVGVVLGALVGATPLTSLVTAWKIPPEFGVATAIGGAAVGALFGFVVGQGRASQLRAAAQRTLCAVRTEQVVSSILELLDTAPIVAPAHPTASRQQEVPGLAYTGTRAMDRLGDLAVHEP